MWPYRKNQVQRDQNKPLLGKQQKNIFLQKFLNMPKRIFISGTLFLKNEQKVEIYYRKLESLKREIFQC
jgi:hypothetical protein